MGRAFKSKNGEYIPHPDDRNTSARIRHRFYIAENKCEICQSSSLRYTKSDKCIMCQRYKIELIRCSIKGDLYWPESVPKGLENDVTEAEIMPLITKLLEHKTRYVLRYEPCTQHGHVVLTDNETGSQCIACDAMLKPREQAAKDGRDTYVSTSPCQGCKDVTVRHTDDGSCVMCGYTPGLKLTFEHRELTPDAVLMRDCPDMVVSKDEARDMGFKVYRTGATCKRGHTGWRYISTGNCIDCIKGGE